jgi:hypothetical protein
MSTGATRRVIVATATFLQMAKAPGVTHGVPTQDSASSRTNNAETANAARGTNIDRVKINIWLLLPVGTLTPHYAFRSLNTGDTGVFGSTLVSVSNLSAFMWRGPVFAESREGECQHLCRHFCC